MHDGAPGEMGLQPVLDLFAVKFRREPPCVA